MAAPGELRLQDELQALFRIVPVRRKPSKMAADYNSNWGDQDMTRNCAAAVGVFLAVSLLISPALAQNEPSAKASAVQSSGTVVSGSEVTQKVMETKIKAPNAKELAIDLSLQCGLYTFTNVKGKGGNTDSSSAGAKVIGKIKVLDSDGIEVPVIPSSADRYIRWRD